MGIIPLQGDGADGAFDGVAIHLDAAIAEEQDQPFPIFGDVFVSFTCWRFGGDLCAGVIHPFFEGYNPRSAFGLTQRLPIISRCAARLCFNPVEGCDLLEPFLSDGSNVVVGQLVQLATGMSLAIRQLDWGVVTQIKHTVVPSIAVHLQDASKALQYL